MNSIRKQLHAPRGQALLGALLSILIMLPVWLWLGNWYQADLIKQARAKAAVEVSARANALTSAVHQRIALLQGLYAFTRTEWPDTQFDQPFQVYSAGIFFTATGVRTLMIAPEGIARYIFPMVDSAALSGFDVLNDPATSADVQRAIHTRGISLSAPGELRQGGFGLTAWEAVYRGTDLWGLVSIAVDMKTILGDAGVTNPAGGLDLALRDGMGQSFSGPSEVWQGDPVTQKIGLPDGAWELGGIPQGGWEAAVRSSLNIFRLTSLLIVLLLAATVYLTVNRQGQLTQAVALRTREIALAQQELEQRVQERTAEVAEKAGQLAVLEERQRLARELHDSVSQVLYSIGLGAKTARAALAHHPAQIPEALDYVDRLAEAGQVEMRALIFELRPESLRTDGLVAALEKQAAVLRTRHELSVKLQLCPEPDVPLSIKETLYRVSQEAIHNIIKHAHATEVIIKLECAKHQICLEVGDNGIGFDPLADYPGHLGLRSMHERAAQGKGDIRFESAPGRGTTVKLVIPC